MSAPYYQDDAVTLWHGDSLDVLRTLPDASVDSVVTDPPYGIGFMGHQWDQPGEYGPLRANGRPSVHRRRPDGNAELISQGAMEAGRYDLSASANQRFQAWCGQWAAECFRVLKPGGHFVSFGGSRTWHRLAAAAEDSGFEIRDSIAWLYGSGFPKSLDVAKAIDKAAGAEREVVGVNPRAAQQTPKAGVTSLGAFAGASADLTAPATPDAARWQGWGTALKPAFEPIVMGRKPLVGTVAANVLAHGTGALNVDGCRVGTSGGHADSGIDSHSPMSVTAYGDGLNGRSSVAVEGMGRWPTNAILDDTSVPVVRLRDNLPADLERAIREFFDAGTDHLPPVRDDRHGSAVPSESAALLLPSVLRGMDGSESGGREGAPIREGAHAGVAGKDERDEALDGTTRAGVVELEGRSAHGRRLRDGELDDARRAGAGSARVDDLKRADRGAPSRDGATDRATALGRGAGASRQRGSIGQSTGEPRTARPGHAHEGTPADRRGDQAATAGELRSAGAPLEVLLRYVPSGWHGYFDLTGRAALSQAAELDRQTGVLTSGSRRPGIYSGLGYTGSESAEFPGITGDSGGASRFFPTFHYEAKAPTSERPRDGEVAHPTVKPLDLMRWLVRLVTPPGGTVLEPFAGSGTTAEACVIEGFRCIAIEREATYLPLIVQRLKKPIAMALDFGESA